MGPMIRIAAVLGGAALLATAAIAAQHSGGHGPPAGLHPHGGGGGGPGAPAIECPLGGPGGGPCGGLIGMFHEILHGLSLTEAQREAVHATMMSRRTEIGGRVRPVIEAQRALRAALLADTADEAAVRASAGAVGASLGDAAVLFAELRAEALASAELTPEQLQKYSELRQAGDAAFQEMLDVRLPALLESHTEK